MTAKESLVFATWNVENLFLPSPNGFGARNQETYDAKIAYLAQTITAMAPDGIALQEIGQAESAADLAQALGGWQSGLSGHPDIRGIRTAVLTPHTITGTTELWAFPDGAMESVPGPDGQVLAHMGRGMVVASIRTPAGTEVQLASVHLKSKLLTFPNNRRFPINEDERASGAGYALLRRAAEAVAVRATLNRIMPAPNGVPTILAGDFNDGPGAVTTDLLTGPADGDPARPDKGDPVRLYNLADRLSPGRAYSRIYNGKGELIDHLLVSRDLLLAVRHVDALIEGITSISESVTSRRDAIRPDHAPLLARFEIQP